jgi:hypothetical protein
LRFQPPDSSADKGALDKLPDRATGQRFAKDARTNF